MGLDAIATLSTGVMLLFAYFAIRLEDGLWRVDLRPLRVFFFFLAFLMGISNIGIAVSIASNNIEGVVGSPSATINNTILLNSIFNGVWIMGVTAVTLIFGYLVVLLFYSFRGYAKDVIEHYRRQR